MLQHYQGPVEGRHGVGVGRGPTLGPPGALLLSLLATHDPNSKIRGLNEVPETDRPPVNIVRYAHRLTGVDRIHMLMGGFHLNGPLFEPLIPPTCEALDSIAPATIVPAHCTG